MDLSKKVKYFSTIVLAIASFLIVACDKTDEPDPIIGTHGSISGSVKLYDEGINEQSNSGMVVSIFGSNPLISDTTDSNGNFSFTNTPYGVYSLSFNKPTYGASMINNVSHYNANTNINKSIQLGQTSSTKTTSIKALDTLGSIQISINTAPGGSADTLRYIRIFYHTNDQVSSGDYTNYSGVISCTTNPCIIRLNPHAIEDMGFEKGSTVWVKAYGDSHYSNDFIEPIKGKHIFPNLNLQSAAASSFIAP